MVGAASYKFDFGGALRRDAQARISTSMGAGGHSHTVGNRQHEWLKTQWRLPSISVMVS